MEPKPLLVVHGVGNRSIEAFDKTTQFLRDKLKARHQLINLFWGDLGGVSEGLADTLPSIFPEALDADEHHTRSGAETQENAVDAIYAKVSGGNQVRSQPEVRSTIEDAVAESTFIKHVDDPEVLDAIGELVAAAAQENSGGNLTRSDGPIGAIISAADTLIGKLTSRLGGSLNQVLRKKMAVPISLTFGDVVGYHQNRDAIMQRLFSVLAKEAPGWGTQEKPINVMAHSLGGLAVVDAALSGLDDRRLWIDKLVTFGSQPAFFHVMAPRKNLAKYEPGKPVTLPGTIKQWTNLWHRMDVLAFIAKPVFRLADGSSPVEVDVASRASEIAELKGWLHSIYWESEELLDAWK